MELVKKAHEPGINRIRLEFKEEIMILCVHKTKGINRIRLEFKGKTDREEKRSA